MLQGYPPGCMLSEMIRLSPMYSLRLSRFAALCVATSTLTCTCTRIARVEASVETSFQSDMKMESDEDRAK
jgi:hypothetical protein